MEKYVFEIRISRLRDSKDTLPFRMAQNNLFNGILNIMLNGFHIDKANISRDALRDDVQVITVEGTKEYCDSIKRQIEGIEDDQIKEFCDKQTYVRSLPAFIRRKLTEFRYRTQGAGYVRLQNTLSLFKISISCDVQPAIQTVVNNASNHIQQS